jgi:hypothetical protein
MTRRHKIRRTFGDCLPGLITRGASLADLYQEMLSLEPGELSAVDASPARLREMAGLWPQRHRFAQIRLSELFGGLAIEHGDDYVLAMIGALGDGSEAKVRAFFLRHDHVLREEVFWRIFEVEGGAEVSLADVDKYSGEGCSWRQTVLDLTADGTLERARVLRSCLQALNRDFPAHQAGWFSRTYTALAPVPGEAAADQDLLRQTLGSPVTASVSLAVRQLAAVHKAGLLEAGAFVAACVPALAGPKTAAMTVLRVLAALAAGNAADPQALAEALAAGLAHPHADVQYAAVTTLRKLGRDDLVKENRALLAPSVAAETAPGDPAQPVHVADGGGALALPAAQPVRQWNETDALERYAALLEDASDAIEFELALAWLATAARAGTLLGPLEKRARARLKHREGIHVAALLLAALDPAFEFLPQEYWQNYIYKRVDGKYIRVERGDPEPLPTEEERSPVPSFITRLREVAAIAQGRVPRRVLLATPTDTHGFIDPAVLIGRFRAGEQAAITPLPADLAQALLRLHPDGREDTLARLRQPPPLVTESISIEWPGPEEPSAEPWWPPAIRAAGPSGPATEHPAVVPSREGQTDRLDNLPPLVAAEVALVHPPSTLPLTAAGISTLAVATWDSPGDEDTVLRVLSRHPGAWTAETAQLVALGMAARRPEVRAQAAELLAAAVPARISPAGAAAGFAACAPECILTRWAGSFADAATMAPGAVVDVLTVLLPQLDPRARGIGALIAVALEESVRTGRQASDPALRAWLGRFTGSSGAARTARALLAAGPG